MLGLAPLARADWAPWCQWQAVMSVQIEEEVFTNSAKGFHGGRWVRLKYGPCVGAVGQTRHGGSR
jgi:hypothetical protein